MTTPKSPNPPRKHHAPNTNDKFKRAKKQQYRQVPHAPQYLDEEYSETEATYTKTGQPCQAPFTRDQLLSNSMIGKYIKLKAIDSDDLVAYQIQEISKEIPIWESKPAELPDLVQDSTNQWLIVDQGRGDDNRKQKWTNICIALVIIIIQIVSYVTMQIFLRSSWEAEQRLRQENCYGPNCSSTKNSCMQIATGGVAFILLLGFLSGDILSTCQVLKSAIMEDCRDNKFRILGCLLIFAEIICAIWCGLSVGIYSENDFEAINGAVGILFVHDLDEKVYSLMKLIESNWKKVLSLIAWIALSAAISIVSACVYPGEYIFFQVDGVCRIDEFQCQNGACVWQGYECNGFQNCVDGSDEHLLCNYSLIQCPQDMLKCESTGTCIDVALRCDGILHCADGSDENRHQNCSDHVAEIDCGRPGFFSRVHPDDDWHIRISNGSFKCNNGQCIDARYLCDGVLGDCIDGSDEYPYFDSSRDGESSSWPFSRECPYSKLIECKPDEALCKVNGKCISKLRVCDGINDCPDGQDERDCKWLFSDPWCETTGKFQCGGQIAMFNDTHMLLFENQTMVEVSSIDDVLPYVGGTGRCLPIEYRCDGMVDCEDGSDEHLCEYFPCKKDETLCQNGQCLPGGWQCEHIPYCVDNQYDKDLEHSFFDHCGWRDNPVEMQCGDLVMGSITIDGNYFNAYNVYIPCPYTAAQFTTCNNITSDFNTYLQVWDAEWTMDFANDDAAWGCDLNYFASTITINSDWFRCDTMYEIMVGGKYLVSSLGTYGIQVICSDEDF